MRIWQSKIGKLTDDDLTAQKNWLVSDPSQVIFGEGGLTINRGNNKTKTRVLADMSSGATAFLADVKYTPLVSGDVGGLCLYNANNETIELLEFADASIENLEEIKVIKNGNVYEFFMKRSGQYVFVGGVNHEFTKIGFVMKEGHPEYEPMLVKRFLETKGSAVRIANIPEGFKVTLGSAEVIADSDELAVFELDDLEYTGELKIYTENGELLTSDTATFYGGDEYTLGTYLQMKLDGNILGEGPENITKLGTIINKELETKLELYNPSDMTANNIKLSVGVAYEDGSDAWSDIAVDEDGAPGEYKKEITLDKLLSGESFFFWLRNKRTDGALDNNVVCVTINLTHE